MMGLRFPVLHMVVAACAAQSVSCHWSFWAESARLSDSSMGAYVAAAMRSNRASLGFSGLPADAKVRVSHPPATDRVKGLRDGEAQVNVSIVESEHLRVLFFRKSGVVEWMGELEVHESGRTWNSPEGPISESLALHYVDSDGTPSTTYIGPDDELRTRSMKNAISAAEVRRIWDEWALARRRTMQ